VWEVVACHGVMRRFLVFGTSSLVYGPSNTTGLRNTPPADVRLQCDVWMALGVVRAWLTWHCMDLCVVLGLLRHQGCALWGGCGWWLSALVE
jgi:hypothetical protein